MRSRAGRWAMGVALLLAVACRDEPTPGEPGQTPEVDARGVTPEQSSSISGIDFDSTREVVGQVADVDPRGLVVSEAGERRLRLRIDPRTQVTVDGRQASTADLAEGSQVRAYFHEPEGGEPTALRIEATSPGRGEQEP